MEYVEVTFKSGNKRTVLKAEAEIAKKEGRLKEEKPKQEVKEKKEAPQTKEKKEVPKSKANIGTKSYGSKGKN